ncbi:MAG TPA: MBL fold metallo-hydrolase [Actinomycetota bacterium]|nr:MBL fold metallo-hydrolase [Actinomycetota bacterium]
MLPVTRVLAPNPGVYTLEGTNTWVVGSEPSIVIDPGPDLPEHLADVARTAGRVGAVLITHDHPDHAPGAVPFATLVGAPLYAYRLAGAEELRAGQRVRAGTLDLTAIHTPGHTSDHISFFEPGSGALFTGDAVVGRGTSFIDPPDGDLVQYLRSLTRMRDLDPRTIYPGHGPLVLRARETILEYLAHREAREAQVLAALDDGPRTITEMVEVIYADHPKEVHPLAARSLLANLLKLADEGRAERSGKADNGPWTASTPRTCQRCGRRVKGKARYCSSCSLAMLQAEG